jgi:DNA-directed RNA polymerase subunit D
MKLSLNKKHGNRIELVVKDMSLTLANVLRRYSMSRVQTMAIESVVFYDNNSAFWDEYIAHRLGLIPITTPDMLPEGAEVVFTLDAEGPKTVHASDLVSTDKEITAAKGSIIIVTLGPGQKLRFEGKAIVGTGSKHAKFQAGLVSYGEDKDSLKLFVESFFQMEPAEVLLRGCDVIESDIEMIEEALGKKPEKKKKAKAPKKKAKESEEEPSKEEGEEKSSKKKDDEKEEKEKEE